MTFPSTILSTGTYSHFAKLSETIDAIISRKNLNDSPDPRQSAAMAVISSAKSSLAYYDDLPISQTKECWKLSCKYLKLSIYKYNGFTDNDFRVKIWMWLLGLNYKDFSIESPSFEVNCLYKQANRFSTFDGQNFAIHTSYKTQIQKDVDRSFTNIQDSAVRINSLRSSLRNLLFIFFHLNPEYHYYQGFHEVASQVILVYNGDLGKCYRFLKVFSLMYLRDFMTKTINPSLNIINIVLYIIYKEDPQYYRIVRSVPPHFLLSAIITVFTHDIKDTEKINQIWEYLLFTGGVTWGSLYLYAATLLLMKQNVLKALYKSYHNIDNDTNNNENNNNNNNNEYEDDDEKDACSPTTSCFEDISLSSSSTSISNSILNDEKHFFSSSPMSGSLFSTGSTIPSNKFHDRGIECSDIKVVDTDVLILKLGSIMEEFLNTDLSDVPGIHRILIDKAEYEGPINNLNVLFSYTDSLRTRIPLFKKLQKDKELIISSESIENNLLIDVLPHSCMLIQKQVNLKSSFSERFEVWEKEIQARPQVKLLAEEEIMNPKVRIQRTMIDRINRHARFEKYALMGKKTMVAISFIIGILSIVLGYYWNSSLLEVNDNLQYLGLKFKFMSEDSNSLKITVGDLVYQFGRKFLAGLSTPKLI